MNATPTDRQIRVSSRVQRIGAALLAAITMLYLAVITYSLSDQINSTKRMLILAGLWLLGLIALWSLSRPWRKRARP